MIVYRIAKQKYQNDLLGNGARVSGGRWNYQGTPVLYTSSSISLCILENLVHADLRLLVSSYSLMHIEVPDDSVKVLDANTLPENWAEYPGGDALKEIGKKWCQAEESLILQVPSAINPHELNALINPVHPRATQISLLKTEAFVFDHRLVKSVR